MALTLAETSLLAAEIAQVVEARLANVPPRGDLDHLDARRVQRKDTLDANSPGIAIIDALVPAQHAAQAVIEEKMVDLGSAGRARAFGEWLATSRQ